MSRGSQHYYCEDYLLAIEDLIEPKGYARICELAELFCVRNASMSGMILRMARKNLVVRRRYRAVTLTHLVHKKASKLRIRRELLNRFLKKLDLQPSDAMPERHALEHVLGFTASRAIRNWLPKNSDVEAKTTDFRAKVTRH
jgi:Mn-dependent DtxR family transcriptional regulator